MVGGNADTISGRCDSVGRACVVGAGLSGVAIARALAGRDVPFDCFDRRSEIGGLCASSAAPRLDVSKERLQFSDWPMPGSYPRLPSARHLAAYLRDYCDRFKLRARIQLESEVRRASRRAEGGWEVELDTGERRTYSTLLVAAGRRGRPLRRAVPGDFAGEQREGSPPPRREELAERDILVVGEGSEACELATEASYVARSTLLSLNRPLYLLPQIAAGRPLDSVPGLDYLRGKAVSWGGLSAPLSRRLRRRALEALHSVIAPPELYGLVRRDVPPAEARMLPAPQLLERLLHGRVDVRAALTRLDGELVHFADGSAASVDLIVWCGSRPRFPFLPPASERATEPLLGVFASPDLAFFGLVEPVAGSPTAIAELQAAWAARALIGDYALPDVDRGAGACPGSRLMRVGQFEYARDVEREMNAGHRRARLRVA